MFRFFLRPRLLLLALPMIVLVMSSLGSNRGLADSQSPEACRNYLNDADLASRFTKPLYVPGDLKSNLSNAKPMFVLEALEYIWRPAAGVCITKWGYNGATPGPTIRTAPQEQVQLLVYNRLPGIIYNPYLDRTSSLSKLPASTAQYSMLGPKPAPPPAPFDRRPYAQSWYEQDPQLTVHLHGGHQVPTYDGDPMDTFPPGRSKMYVYPNNEDASTMWYHDHDMDHTRAHVLMGLAGFYLIEDRKADEQLGLPTGEYDIPIMFQQVPTELLDVAKPGRPVWTVNNTLAPYYEVFNRPYRFRFLNGNDETGLNISIADTKDAATPSKHLLQQVGTDGGLMNSVSKKEALRLYPAERGDVVIDFSGIPAGTTIYLQAAAADVFKDDPVDKTAQSVIEFRVRPLSDPPPKFSPKGGILLSGDKQITKLTAAGARERTFYLDFPAVPKNGSPAFATINGQFYDEHRIDASPQRGDTEIWTFVNNTKGYHPMHIHDIEFQVISRTDQYGHPVEMEPGDWGSDNLAWKDVFVVPPSGRVSIIGRFDDNLGVYVFHCHNLEHEDGGMMGQFQVVEPGATTVTVPPKSHMGH